MNVEVSSNSAMLNPLGRVRVPRYLLKLCLPALLLALDHPVVRVYLLLISSLKPYVLLDLDLDWARPPV